MSTTSSTLELARLVREGRMYWASQSGQAVRQAERACLGPVCEGVFGAHSLELGMGVTMADMCPVRHPMRWAPTRELADDASTLVCQPDALPLPDECLSLVVIHHLLEVVPHPHHALQEAARVTAAEGRLIIFGWAPLGPGGLSRALPRRRRRLPWRGHWRTPGRLGDWLAFVDFEIERVDYCGFHLPGSLPCNAMLETLGRRHNLPLGDSYMIHARRKSQIVRPQGASLPFARPLGTSSLGGAARLGQARSEHELERTTEGD
ncbi:methyltransferase domain-containing protein [Halomonas sp. TRM85114]|nr:methyltransferase domain-containing protein [Halomonas jincaotanensis]